MSSHDLFVLVILVVLSMMPSYNQNRWTAVYFVSFMVLSFFFLMNVILASVVGEYESAVATRNTERVNHANENLKEAFNLMDPKDTGRIDRETVMALFLLLNEDFPEVRRISDDDTKLLFAVLDKDGSSTISEEEFMDFGNVLLLEFIRTDVYKSVVEIYFPSIYSSHWYKRFETMIKSDAFEHGIDLILCFNAVVIGIQSYPELSSAKVHLDPKLYDGSIDVRISGPVETTLSSFTYFTYLSSFFVNRLFGNLSRRYSPLFML